MRIVCKLKELMDKEGISQSALAEKINLAPGTIGKLYRDQVSRIDEKTLIAIYQYFKLTSISELFEVVED